MTFLRAAFLLGLAGAAVPVVLHLICRQRYPERPFTTLRFFRVTIKHNVMQRRLIDRLLLLLRVLALVALALALARPFWSGPLGEARRSVVVVLDNSPSMGRSAGSRTLFAKAQTAALSLLADRGAADRLELVLTAPAPVLAFTPDHAVVAAELHRRQGERLGLLVRGAAGRDAAVPGLTTDTNALLAALRRMPADADVAVCGWAARDAANWQSTPAEILQRLASAQVSDVPGDLTGALQRAAALLRSSQDGDRRLYLFSDLPQAKLAQTAAVPGLAGVAILVVRLEATTVRGPNLAVTDVRPETREAGLGQSMTAAATVVNCGTQPVAQAKLLVTAGLGGRAQEVSLPPVPAGATVRVAFPMTVMSRFRDLLCRATVSSPADTFAYDDTWYFQVGVVPPVSVLCVNGAPNPVPAARDAFFVMSALGLSGTGGRGVSGLDARECELDALAGQTVFQYRVLVLAGVDRLDETLRAKLRQFVNDGGALLVFPGRGPVPEEYNGWGLLPARVTRRNVQQFTHVETLGEATPGLAALAGRVAGGCQTLTTRDWLGLEPDPDSRVLAAFAGGAPALVEKTIGRGRVVLAATGAHTASSDWPLRPVFPALIRGLVEYLGQPAQPVTLVPERVVGTGAARAIPADLELGTPAAFFLAEGKDRTRYEALPWWRNGSALALPQAVHPGQYLLSVTPGQRSGLQAEPGVGAQVVPVSVNHGPDEGRAEALPAARLAALFPGATLAEKQLTEGTALRLADLPGGRDLWRILAIAALLFLVIESLLGWRVPSQAAG